MHDFSESWTSWEMHPHGEEVVICTAGQLTLIQELKKGSEEHIGLSQRDYAIDPAGIGTQRRER